MAVPAGRKSNTFGRDKGSNTPVAGPSKDRKPNEDVSWRPEIATIASPQMASMGSRQAVADPSMNGITSGDARGNAEGDQVDQTLRRDEPMTTKRTGGGTGRN